MISARAFFALFMGLSVALLPMPAAFAHAVSDDAPHAVPGDVHHEMPGDAHHAMDADDAAGMECCHGNAPCDKSEGNGCGSLACQAKCLGVTGIVAPSVVTLPPTPSTEVPAIADQSVHTGATAPPLPPPRV
jgi:hypothetical protein